MLVRNGGVDRPLGPIKASTKVLERWFVGVSLGAESGVKRFDTEYAEKKRRKIGERMRDPSAGLRQMDGPQDDDSHRTVRKAEGTERTVNRRHAKRQREAGGD
jgi:hypothetical protein